MKKSDVTVTAIIIAFAATLMFASVAVFIPQVNAQGVVCKDPNHNLIINGKVGPCVPCQAPPQVPPAGLRFKCE